MAKLILGLDEVGRGPIAGPLVIGACVLAPQYLDDGRLDPREAWQSELTDSKALSESRREKLAPIIQSRALAYGFGWVPAEELDALGIVAGLKTAARRAVDDLVGNFPDVAFSEIIVDGNIDFLAGSPYAKKTTTVIKADLKIKAVSAASIIAKVTRDHYMASVAGAQYPKYGFAKHKGYGTELHWQKLRKNGPCPEHRWIIARISKAYPTRPLEFQTRATERVPVDERFIPSEHPPTGVFARPKKNPTAVGNAAERKIAQYLVDELHHKILSRNFKRKNCEIDIVSATAERIYFTEVKYRSNPCSGTPIEAITPRKLAQMKHSSAIYMAELSSKLGRSLENLPSPVLAVGAVYKDGTSEWFELSDD